MPNKQKGGGVTAPDVSSLNQFWQDNVQGVVVELPDSGLRVRLRPLSLGNLVRRGLIPNTLYLEAMKGFPELVAKKDDDVQAIDPARIAELMLMTDDLMFTVLSESMVWPKLSLTPDIEKEEIGYEMISETDRHHIFGMVQTPVRVWVRFLSEQAPSVPVVADGDGVPL